MATLPLLLAATQARAEGLVDQSLLDQFEESLRLDLLEPYYPDAQDELGGFVEDRSSSWELEQGPDKFSVAQARYTWMAAKAAGFYAGEPESATVYQQMAAHGFDFLRQLWGASYDGHTGWYVVVDPDGKDGRVGDKRAFIMYANAFGVYASAAYFRLTDEPAVLDQALAGYAFLESYGYDPTNGGYSLSPEESGKETNMNLHVLEALIELYQALPRRHAQRAEVGSRVEELLARFHDQAIHCETDSDCFAYPVMAQDWSGSGSEVSFGHDVELAFLMVEGLEALGHDALAHPYLPKICAMVDFTFSHDGFRDDGALYYGGTYAEGSVTVTDPQLQWWPQAEALGTLCMMRRLFPEDSTYAATLQLVWDYIGEHFIDAGERGWVGAEDGWTLDKGFEWHTNYHNGRALMNCLRWHSARYAPDVDTVGGAGAGSAAPTLMVRAGGCSCGVWGCGLAHRVGPYALVLALLGVRRRHRLNDGSPPVRPD